MRKTRILSALPFLAVLALLVGAVLTRRALRSRTDDALGVNTMADADGEVHTVRVFESISSVMAIDRDNHSRKKEIPAAAYSYDSETTLLTFKEPLPYADTVVHIEGKVRQPEQFYLHDFGGDSGDLLVILGERIAIEDYEYTFDQASRLLTFRSDIHPETDGSGNFHIGYETENGAHHGFGNWKEKDYDTLSALQWQHLHKTQGAPMLVMKMRNRRSDRQLSKEAGFSISLPKTRSKLDGTFIVESMEDNEKRVTVQRYFDKEGLMVEARKDAFAPSEKSLSTEEIRFGGLSVQKTRVIGTYTDSLRKEPTEIPLAQYDWQKDGTFYQIVAREEQTADAEGILGEIR